MACGPRILPILLEIDMPTFSSRLSLLARRLAWSLLPSDAGIHDDDSGDAPLGSLRQLQATAQARSMMAGRSRTAPPPWAPTMPSARVMSERLPATFRVAAAASHNVPSRRDANATAAGGSRPLHVYMDNQDPRRTRMAGSFSDVCAALDQLVHIQECAAD